LSDDLLGAKGEAEGEASQGTGGKAEGEASQGTEGEAEGGAQGKQKGPKGKGKKKGPKGKGKKKGPKGKKKAKKAEGQQAPIEVASTTGKCAAIDKIPDFKEAPTCCTCKVAVDPLRMRLIGKSQGCWQCLQCGARYTALHKAWGGWPPAEWDAFTEEEKAQFWRDLKTKSGTEAQEEFVLNFLKSKVIESRISGSRGNTSHSGPTRSSGTTPRPS